MFKPFLFALGISALTASSLLTAVPAGADDMAMSKMDCSKAGSMMSDAAKMGSSATMTGDQDKDFVAIMMDHEKGTMMMMKVEAACGKDPKVKAVAQKGLVDEEQRMAIFRNMNTSQ